MALRRIFTKDDPVLRKKCRPVTEYNERIAQLMDDLRDTLAEANGLGLAAPQVGILRRAVIIVDNEETVELLNPEIIESEGEIGMDEACLSCPGIAGYVVRPAKVKVRANTRDGEVFEREFEEISARAVCHEADHLDGILFTDIADNVHEDTQEYYDSLNDETEDEVPDDTGENGEDNNPGNS